MVADAAAAETYAPLLFGVIGGTALDYVRGRSACAEHLEAVEQVAAAVREARNKEEGSD